jgi:hypothetical protein
MATASDWPEASRPFHLVHHQNVERAQHPGWRGAGWRQVQDSAGAAPLGPLEQHEGCFGRHLVLAEQRDARGQIGVGHLLGAGVPIGPARYHDLVFGRAVDPDHGDAGRLTRCDDILAVHTGRLQGRAREMPEAIVADMADHVHRRTSSGRGRRLIGALAAGCHLVARTQHRLASPRQGFDPEQQIDVDGAEHQEHSRALPGSGVIGRARDGGPRAPCCDPCQRRRCRPI